MPIGQFGLRSTVAANLAARCGGGAVSGLAPLANSRALPSLVFLHAISTNLAAGSPPLMVKMGACQVRGGAGPRTKHGALAQLTQQSKGGVGLSQPHASLGVGGPKPRVPKSVLVFVELITFLKA